MAVKIALVVEYNGNSYHGFEWQAGLRTIQGELEQAIQKLTGESRRVIGASRTDAGVHAKGQVVSFRTESELPLRVIVRALNFHLPSDIAVQAAYHIRDDFSVRSDALSREYDYSILNRPCRSALARDFSHLVARELDIESMNQACQIIEGEHDFASFATSWEGDRSSVRKVYQAKVERHEAMVNFHIVASSFLPHQVRNTVGLLTRLGLGKMELTEFIQIMEAKRPGKAGPAAPARGLCLTRVNYGRPLGE